MDHSIAVDIDQAIRFLRRLDPDPKARFAFQTFDDAKLGRVHPQVLWTPCADRLVALSERGAGVFVAPNRFKPNARARTNDNVIEFRACWADLDGAPLDPVLAGPLHPHVVVQSSPGRWQCWWVLDGGADEPTWRAVQKALSARFGSDASVNFPAAVMRLPGFVHRKIEPGHLVRIVLLREAADYCIGEMAQAFGVTATEPRAADPMPDFMCEGTGRVALLTSFAGTMRRRGAVYEEILPSLLAINVRRCRPPYPTKKVEETARGVCKYEPGDAWMADDDASDAAFERWAREQADETAAFDELTRGEVG